MTCSRTPPCTTSTACETIASSTWRSSTRSWFAGQQELYVALRGAGAVVIGDQRLPLDPEHLVRVDAAVDRVLTSGAGGLRVLCVGGVPEAACQPPWTDLGGAEA